MSLDLSSMSDDDLKALYSNTQAIHNNESNGASDSATIVNPASGAEGSMQVMKATQKDPGFGVRASDGSPEDTARAGRDYYAAMSQKYKDPFTAAVAYNWGPGNADKWIKNGGKLEDLPEETLKYAYKMHQQQPGQDPAARTETPAAPKSTSKNPAVPKDSKKEDGGFLKTADDFVRGVADTATFGLADKFAAKMDELTGRTQGTTYDQNLAAERQKDKDGGVANTAGQVAGALVPGLGVLKAAQAPAQASRVVRGLYGAGAGAVEGAASGAGHSDSDDLADKAKDTLQGGAIGAAIGGPLAAVLPSPMKQKVGSYIAKQGGEEQARRIAEASQDLRGLATREAQGGKALGSKNANSISEGYIADAAKHIKDPEALEALQAGRRLSDAQLASLPEDVREVINKATTMQAQTGAKPAWNNLAARTARHVVDWMPLPRPVADLVKNHALGGRETREVAIQKLLDQAPVADKVLEKLGPSKGAQALKTLQDQARSGSVYEDAINRGAALRAKAVLDVKTQAAFDRAQASAQGVTQKEAQQTAKETAARAQDIQKRRSLYTDQRQAQSAAVRGEQSAAEAQAQQALAARAQASQGNLANSIETRQGQSQALRDAQAAAEQAQAARRAAGQQRTSQFAEQRQEQSLATRTARPVPVDNTKELAVRAKAAQDRQAAYTAQRQAQSAEVRGTKAAEVADEMRAAGSKRIAEGNFEGLDISNPRAAALLEHVDHPDVAAVQQTLSAIAAKDPSRGRVIHQLLTPGGRKLTKQEFYGLQHDLQQVHGKRVVEAPTQGALSEASPGALSSATSHAPSGVQNPQAYEAGIANRQDYARKTFDKAPEGPVKDLVAKLSTLSNEDVRRAKFNSVYAKASPTEREFMDRKVAHMIDYGSD